MTVVVVVVVVCREERGERTLIYILRWVMRGNAGIYSFSPFHAPHFLLLFMTLWKPPHIAVQSARFTPKTTGSSGSCTFLLPRSHFFSKPSRYLSRMKAVSFIKLWIH